MLIVLKTNEDIKQFRQFISKLQAEEYSIKHRTNRIDQVEAQKMNKKDMTAFFSKAKIEDQDQTYSVVFDFDEGFKFKSKSSLSGGKKKTTKKPTRKPKTAGKK